ncbi:ribulose-phosphate 3-epimerase [Candidatus Gracilibacteria bacterium]|nr:ribulose-phosphate 3-epimerase [Candidatus Gracilibacteria bacterium]
MNEENKNNGRKIKLAPSILSADFGRLNEEIKSVEEFVDMIHVDVMDGHFVPNITLGAPVVKFIKSKLPLDVHLMIENPEKFIKDFADAGAKRIVVHSEACGENLRAVLMMIKSFGCECGVSIKPATSVDAVKDVLDLADEVLVMTVNPGFGGQSFMEDMVPKIRELRALGYQGDIAVDGGINDKTAPVCIDAGANLLISGSYFFKAVDKKEAAQKIKGGL